MNDFYKLGPCSTEQLPEILSIFNEAIMNSTALYEYVPRNMEFMHAWYESKLKKNYPITGAFDRDGKLLGFGTYGVFRERPAYKYTVEHSVYVHLDARGKGLGKILLHEIIKLATEQDYHVLVGGIDASNNISIRLHEQLGFEFCGRVKQAAYKFGRWLDLDFYQLILKTPEKPVDG